MTRLRSRLYRSLIAAATIGCASLSPALAGDPSALTTVTTEDGTASVGIPAGWKVVKGSKGFMDVTGPNDERVNLGVIAIGKNAAAGSRTGGEVAFALPFGASLEDKLTAIIHGGAAKAGLPEPDITYAGRIPTKLPMCGRFVGGWTAGSDSRKFEAILCSLQPDMLGLYKNIVFLAQVPASLAQQDRPVVEKIAGSYRVTPAMFKNMLAPYTTPPALPASGGAMPAAARMAPYQDPTNSDCFDYNVIRESPPWEVPMHCGGTQPG